MTRPPCAAPNCPRPSRTRDWCNRHYENWRRYGDPVPRRDRGLDERLREVGWTVTDSGCWEWNGKRNANGYGIFDAKRLGLENERAHRVVYMHVAGLRLTDDQQLRHKCDNPPCVNPAHLLPGTHADNMADMVERRRHHAHTRSTCPNGHDITAPGATRVVRRANRNPELACVECARDRSRRYEQRVRAKA